MAVQIGGISIDLESNIASFSRDLQRASQMTRATSGRMVGQFGRIERSVGEATEKVDRFTKAVRRVSMPLTAAGGIAGAIGAIAALEQLRLVLAEVREIGQAARRIQFPSDELQALRFEAAQLGIDAGNVDDAIRTFVEGIGEASVGTGQLYEVLAANGVALRDTEGNLRSTTDLLEVYRRLLRGAASEQEMLTLAVRGFGEDGSAFGIMLRETEQSLADVTEAAKEMGIVLDAEMIQRADAILARWSEITWQLDVGLKGAILGVIDALGGLRGAWQGVLLAATEAGAAARAALGWSDEAIAAYRLRNRMAIAELGGDPEGMFDRGDVGAPTTPEITVGRTVVPGAGGGGRAGAAAAAAAQTSAVAELIARLEEELRLVGATDVQRRIANALRQAGADATALQRARIEELITAIVAEEATLERSRAAQEGFATALEAVGSQGLAVLNSLAAGIGDVEDAARRAALRIADMVLEAALMGRGPFSGVFGPGLIPQVAEGLSGAIPRFAGGFATGGTIGLGEWGIVGERGAEIVRAGLRGAEVIPIRETPPAPAAAAPAAPAAPVVNVYISTPDVEGFRRARSQVAADLSRAVDLGRRNR